MQLDLAIDQLLSPYMSRVQVRAGNGLTKSMNSSLRSYPEIPRIIRRTVTLLVTTEVLFGLSGTVAIRYSDLYRLLIDTHEDWYRELPCTTNHTLAFVRKPRLPLHQFTAAWTIARRLRLLDGHGVLKLHSNVLSQLRSWYDKV